MRTLFFLLIALFFSNSLQAQWDTYQATWEGKPGIVLINMEWRRFAPIEELPYLLVVQKSILQCDTLGFGTEEEENLIRIAFESIDSLLSLYTYAESVGTLAHDCQIREYFYIQDTLGLNSKLRPESFNNNWNYKLLHDEEWKGYLGFLYPDDFLIQTMVNSKAIAQMVEDGDDPKIKRLLKHAAGFSSEENRISFSKVLKERGFKLLDESYNGEELLPYRLTFSRKDHLEIKWISEITMHLVQNAQEFYGQYGGWETEL